MPHEPLLVTAICPNLLQECNSDVIKKIFCFTNPCYFGLFCLVSKQWNEWMQYFSKLLTASDFEHSTVGILSTNNLKIDAMVKDCAKNNYSTLILFVNARMCNMHMCKTISKKAPTINILKKPDAGAIIDSRSQSLFDEVLCILLMHGHKDAVKYILNHTKMEIYQNKVYDIAVVASGSIDICQWYVDGCTALGTFDYASLVRATILLDKPIFFDVYLRKLSQKALDRNAVVSYLDIAMTYSSFGIMVILLDKLDLFSGNSEDLKIIIKSAVKCSDAKCFYYFLNYLVKKVGAFMTSWIFESSISYISRLEKYYTTEFTDNMLELQRFFVDNGYMNEWIRALRSLQLVDADLTPKFVKGLYVFFPEILQVQRLVKSLIWKKSWKCSDFEWLIKIGIRISEDDLDMATRLGCGDIIIAYLKHSTDRQHLPYLKNNWIYLLHISSVDEIFSLLDIKTNLPEEYTHVSFVQSQQYMSGEFLVFSFGPFLYIGQIKKVYQKTLYVLDVHIYQPKESMRGTIKYSTFKPYGILIDPKYVTAKLNLDEFNAEKERALCYDVGKNSD